MHRYRASIATIRPSRRLASIGLTLLIAFAILVSNASATQAQAQPGSTPKPALTADDLAAFMDGLIPVQLRQNDIAGAVIVVVKDGKVLFARGYGYADVEAKTPVTPDATLFRLASISKLFTCTAVMQLVEQGKLDIDGDVNQYLDFQIPATYAQPITLRNLLTHTAGFQETIRGHHIPESGRLSPLKEYLPANLPPRIFAPGTTPAYSNYGNALLGYVIERVSGQSFEDYVEEHIFRPLGMKNSTYAQPLPNALKPLMSNGYLSGSEPAKPFEIIQTYPGGGSSVTGEDMARFMIAHLQEGGVGDARILKAETARTTHSRQFGLSPSMNGSAFGFAEQTRNGYRAIGHGGDLQCFHSQLFLVPELGVGFFFSQNSMGRTILRTTIWRSFFDRYFPLAGQKAEPSGPASNPNDLAGLYKSTRRFDLSIFKLGSLTGQVRVTANSDGSLRCDLINEFGRPKTLREIAPMKYCEEKGEDCIAFRRDDAGRLQLLGDFPHAIFQPVPWYEKRPLNIAVLIGSSTVFALTLVLWPIAAVTRRHYGRSLDLTRSQRRIRLLVRIVCAVDLGFLIAGRMLLLELPNESLEIWVRLLQVVGIAGALGGLIVIYDAVRCWTERDRWWAGKAASVVVALACLCFAAFALIWNLFDLSTRY